MKTAFDYSHWGIWVAVFNRYGQQTENRFFSYPVGPCGPIESNVTKELAATFAAKMEGQK